MNLNFGRASLSSEDFTSLDLFNITGLFAYRNLIYIFLWQIVLKPVARQGFALDFAQDLSSQPALPASL